MTLRSSGDKPLCCFFFSKSKKADINYSFLVIRHHFEFSLFRLNCVGGLVSGSIIIAVCVTLPARCEACSSKLLNERFRILNICSANWVWLSLVKMIESESGSRPKQT